MQVPEALNRSPVQGASINCFGSRVLELRLREFERVQRWLRAKDEVVLRLKWLLLLLKTVCRVSMKIRAYRRGIIVNANIIDYQMQKGDTFLIYLDANIR